MKKIKKIKKNNKGFSLVELIVVVAIMAVLMGVLAPQFLKYVEKSRVQKDESAAGEVLNATKIALTDEKIFAAMGFDSTKIKAKIVVGDDSTIVAHKATADGTGTDAVADMATELESTIGKIDFVSGKHNSGTFNIIITYAPTTSSFTFTPDTGWGL